LLTDLQAQELAAVTLDASQASDWDAFGIQVKIEQIHVLFGIDHPLDSAQRKVSCDLSGVMKFGGEAEFDMKLSYPDFTATGTLTAVANSNLSLTGLLMSMLGINAGPDELPDLIFPSLNVSVTPGQGTFKITGESSVTWDALPLGISGSYTNTVDFTVKREPVTPQASPPNGTGSGSQASTYALSCSLDFKGTGPITIVDGLIFQNAELAFDLDEAAHTWDVSGSISATVLDTDLTLTASLDNTQAARTLNLEVQSGSGLSISIGSASLTGNDLKITISKALAQAAPTGDGSSEQAGTGGVTLQASSPYSWSISTTGKASLTGVFDLDGTLELMDTGTSISLAFKPNNATVSIPLQPLQQLTTELGLDDLAIVGTTDDQGKKSWSFDTTIDIWFSGVPDKLQLSQILPSDQSHVQGHFKVDDQGALVEVENLVSIADLNIPEIDFGLSKLNLGQTAVTVSNFQLQLDKNITLSTEFGFGIPGQLNAVFGTSADGSALIELFNTYDPQAQGTTPSGSPSTSLMDNPTITRFKLSLNSSKGLKGLQVQMLTSPIKAITFTRVTDNTTGETTITCDADFGEFGAITFTLPAFSFNGNSFSASGSFTQTRELKLPLVPLKLLLQACKLNALADRIPDGFPLREVKIYDEQAKTFDAEALITLLNDLGGELGSEQGGSAFALGDVIEEAIRSLENYLDRLPDSFKSYLDISIPREFSFSLSITEEGTFQGSVSTDPSTPIKLLSPAMGLLGPQLNGFTLRSFSIGEMFGGALLPVNIDMDMHLFNLPTLLPALVLPVDPTPLLPSTQDLITHIPVSNLFMIVITETVIPIPVPIFFDLLGLEYLGLEGVNFQVHGSFPNPLSNLSAADALTLFSAFRQFFTDQRYLLDASKLPQVLPTLTIGPNALQLPQYLGGNKLIDPANPADARYNPVINLMSALVSMLNTFKQSLLQSFNLSGIVQSIPLDRRRGQQELTIAGMNLAGAKWLITTPQELSTPGPAQQNLANALASDINSTLQLLPAAQAQTLIATLSGKIATATGPALDKLNADLRRAQTVLNAAQGQGIALFLKGTLLNSLSASFGLLATKTGFHTGMNLSGNIGNWLNLELTGVVGIDPQASPVFGLAGQSSLVIVGQQIFEGDVQINDQGFLLDGHIDLFPSSPLRVVGDGTLQISSQGVYLNTQVAVTIQNTSFTLAASSITITNSSITITGQWLGSQATLNIVFGQNDFTLNGTFSFQLGLNTKIGPLYDPSTGIKVVDAIPLNTSASASFAVTLDAQQGFAANVTASFMWNNQLLPIPNFSITVPPLQPSDIGSLIVQHASVAFAALFHTVADWLKGAVQGVVQLTNQLAPAVQAASAWGTTAWNAVESWSSFAWHSASQWSSAAWQATTQWSDSAWQATTTWGNDTWNATTQWSDKTWNESVNWTTDQWNQVSTIVSSAHVDTPVEHYDTPAVHTDTPGVLHIDIPGYHTDTPAQHGDIPGSHVDAPPHADSTSDHGDSYAFFGLHTDIPGIHFDIPHGDAYTWHSDAVVIPGVNVTTQHQDTPTVPPINLTVQHQDAQIIPHFDV
jgi:hypothetical protein